MESWQQSEEQERMKLSLVQEPSLAYQIHSSLVEEVLQAVVVEVEASVVLFYNLLLHCKSHFVVLMLQHCTWHC